MILTGIGLVVISMFVSLDVTFATLIYGIPVLIVGIFILLNKKEDKIEEIKSKRRKK